MSDNGQYADDQCPVAAMCGPGQVQKCSSRSDDNYRCTCGCVDQSLIDSWQAATHPLGAPSHLSPRRLEGLSVTPHTSRQLATHVVASRLINLVINTTDVFLSRPLSLSLPGSSAPLPPGQSTRHHPSELSLALPGLPPELIISIKCALAGR